MQQVKFFKGVEADLSDFESQINGWMEEVQQSGGRIVEVSGNIAPQTVATEKRSGMGGFSPSDLFIIVVYEPGG